jgi:lipopolysaccharide export system protein LptA
MIHRLPHTLLCALTLVVCCPVRVVAQSSSDGSALNSLDKSPLLGNSFNDKEFGKLPTHITSDTLTLNNKTRIFIYRGNVVVTQGEMRLTSKEIEGSYSEQNEIQKIIAKGDVRITKQDIISTSQRATYDAINSVIVLTENPQLQQGESVLIADRIKVFLNDNRSMAEGNVRVTVVKNQTPVAQAAPASTSPIPTPAPTSAAPVEAASTPVAVKSAAPTSKPATKATSASTKSKTSTKTKAAPKKTRQPGKS